MRQIRPSRWVPAILLGAVFAAATPANARAQDTTEVVQQVIGALSAAEPGRLAPLLGERVRLSVEGIEHDGVTPRQATAELDRFLGDYETSAPTTVRSGAQDEASRAFAELAWSLRSARTEELHPFVVFLGLELLDQRWLIREIRILRQADS